MGYSDLVAPAPECLFLNFCNFMHPGSGVFLSAYYGRHGCDPKIGAMGMIACHLYDMFGDC